MDWTWVKEIKQWLDLGLSALILAGLYALVVRPPRWVVDFVESHRVLATSIQELPRRDEFKFQDLLIGQEIILRELADVKRRLGDGGR